ncbi:hypothetical protein E4U21_002886 [Claviceps maximensis]|nr:hypothetical protein E4U21_002886 [Claviceps maximensis]
MRLSTGVSAIASALLLLHSAEAALVQKPMKPLPPPDPNSDDDLTRARARGVIKNATFEQLIDHRNPRLGTFSQRYWYNAEFYAGPGAPIIVRGPEEGQGWDGFTSNYTQSGIFGQTNGAAVVTIEHRYWGKSSPYANLTVQNLQHLNLDNAVQDLVYFANNVVFPFDPKRTSSPDKAPWVLTGCSYAGAVSAWVHRVAPGTYWAHHCSSAVVEAISNLWRYYEPVKMAMPKNCSTDVVAVVKHIDQVLSTGQEKAMYDLKRKFGLEALSHNSDFASVLLLALWDWQGTDFADTGTNPFYQFCDYVENIFPETKHHQLPGPEGVGLEKAINGFGRFYAEVKVPGYCNNYRYWKGESNSSVSCFDYSNKDFAFYHDTSVGNAASRQWQWLLCNEPLEFWQVKAPPGIVDTGLVSKFVDIEYQRMQCAKYFPREGNFTYGLNAGRSVDTVNKWTRGWTVDKPLKRIMFTSGELDPWRPATVSADARPGGRLRSTPDAPVWVIPGAAHCTDLWPQNAKVNPEFAKIFDEILVKMHAWLDEFYVEKKLKRPSFKKSGHWM